MIMQSMIETITAYLHSHSFESEGWGNETVLDQLNQVYWESRESVSPELKDGFQELGRLLETLPLDDDSGRTCCVNLFFLYISLNCGLIQENRYLRPTDR